MLIDDVATTCSTLNETAKALLAAGARRVDALVFARTLE
jgi:predicted amidophosphoribosyltransferase